MPGQPQRQEGIQRARRRAPLVCLNVIHELSTPGAAGAMRRPAATPLWKSPQEMESATILPGFWGDENVQWLHTNVVLHLGGQNKLLEWTIGTDPKVNMARP